MNVPRPAPLSTNCSRKSDRSHPSRSPPGSIRNSVRSCSRRQRLNRANAGERWRIRRRRQASYQPFKIRKGDPPQRGQIDFCIVSGRIRITVPKMVADFLVGATGVNQTPGTRMAQGVRPPTFLRRTHLQQVVADDVVNQARNIFAHERMEQRPQRRAACSK